MKHTLPFLVFLCLTFSSIAQDIEGWHIGATLQASHYWLYNKDELDAGPLYSISIDSKKSFNAFTGGISVAKYFSSYFGLRGELTYSTQKVNYIRPLLLPSTKYVMFRRLDYIKIPMMASFVLHSESRSSFYIDAGLQASIFAQYRSESTSTETTTSKLKTEVYFYNKSYSGRNYSGNIVEDYGGTYDLPFKRFQLGGVSELGWLLAFNESWHFRLGIKGEYDFIKAENKKSKNIYNGIESNFWYSEVGRDYKTIDQQRFSNNIRLGLNLSLTYKIDR